MRVSDSMNYMKTQSSLNKNRTEMADLQTQAASQKRINKPSDDPVAMTKVLNSRTEEKGIEQYLKNIDTAQSFLDFTDQSLEELTGALNRAKELALSQANDPSSSPLTRRSVATEVRQLYNQTLQVANRRFANRYIFGGYHTTDKPFENDGTYKGDRGEIMVEVNKGDLVAMNLPGDTIFFGRGMKTGGVLEATPKSESELRDIQIKELQDNLESGDSEYGSIRGPASEKAYDPSNTESYGENIFRVLADLETGLMANDKGAIQDAIEQIDTSLDQVVHSRARVGSRVQNLQSAGESLRGADVEEKSRQSLAEDVDAYDLFSKLSQNETTLKATMATSAKILQPSLLDFLR